MADFLPRKIKKYIGRLQNIRFDPVVTGEFETPDDRLSLALM